MTSLVMLCLWCWHQHHMMPVTSSVTLLHPLGQYDQIEVQHDIMGHVTSLALTWASHGVDTIVNGTILFLRSR